MKNDLLSSLDSFPYFTITSVRQILGDEFLAAGTIRTMLYRRAKAGELIELKNGIYMPRRFFEQHRAEADFAPAVSAILLPQSYVSLEYMLQRHGVLTETTYPVSAVTLKHTRLIKNLLGTFSYRNIKNALYTGFSIDDFHGIAFSRASKAKALFDYLYLRPSRVDEGRLGFDLTEELRLNLEEFSSADRDEFAGFVELSRSAKMVRILQNVERTAWQL